MHDMDPKVRRQVLRSLSNGIYVVTSRSAEGHSAATLTWMTQTSFEPPLLVAGVQPDSGIAEYLQASQRAVIHVLAAGQESIAKRFFSRPDLDMASQPPTLGGLPFTESADGLAILEDAAAYAECHVLETIDCGGDHHLVVFEVTAVEHRGDFEPLTVHHSPWEYGG